MSRNKYILWRGSCSNWALISDNNNRGSIQGCVDIVPEPHASLVWVELKMSLPPKGEKHTPSTRPGGCQIAPPYLFFLEIYKERRRAAQPLLAYLLRIRQHILCANFDFLDQSGYQVRSKSEHHLGITLTSIREQAIPEDTTPTYRNVV